MEAIPGRLAISTPKLDPLSLVGAVLEGSDRAARQLVRAHQGMVHGVISKMMCPVGRGHVVEDLAQETFIKAFAALHRFDSNRGRFSTWLLTIASRLALDELKKKKPYTMTAPGVFIDAMQGTGGEADHEANRKALAMAIEGAAGRLSAEQRIVFILKDTQHLSYAEIAEVLDIDLGTVKSRLSRARVALKKSLEEFHHG